MTNRVRNKKCRTRQVHVAIGNHSETNEQSSTVYNQRNQAQKTSTPFRKCRYRSRLLRQKAQEQTSNAIRLFIATVPTYRVCTANSATLYMTVGRRPRFAKTLKATRVRSRYCVSPFCRMCINIMAAHLLLIVSKVERLSWPVCAEKRVICSREYSESASR